MKLKYKQTDKNPLSSFFVKRINKPYLGENWHFHEEYELIYFIKGTGMRIVGDHISNFQAGELVLVGQWLPHLWRNNTIADTGAGAADFIVIKFHQRFQGVDLFSLPELSAVKAMLAKSTRGIQFSFDTSTAISTLMKEIHQGTGAERLIFFLQLMKILAADRESSYLVSPDFVLPSEVTNENRLQKIISHIFANYNQNISLDEISSLAFMTSPAFCRFFKSRTNKTFFSFLNEFRVNRACQFLIENEHPIKEICFKVGFRSLTNFNRTFKKIKGVTPGNYQANSAELRRQLQKKD